MIAVLKKCIHLIEDTSSVNGSAKSPSYARACAIMLFNQIIGLKLTLLKFVERSIFLFIILIYIINIKVEIGK